MQAALGQQRDKRLQFRGNVHTLLLTKGQRILERAVRPAEKHLTLERRLALWLVLLPFGVSCGTRRALVSSRIKTRELRYWSVKCMRAETAQPRRKAKSVGSFLPFRMHDASGSQAIFGQKEGKEDLWAGNIWRGFTAQRWMSKRSSFAGLANKRSEPRRAKQLIAAPWQSRVLYRRKFQETYQ